MLSSSSSRQSGKDARATGRGWFFDGFAQRILVANKAVLFTILLATFLSFASPYFLTTANLFNVLEQIVVMTIVALAYTLLLGAGEIDLSIGGIVGLVGVIMGKLMVVAGVPWFVAIGLGLAFGGACGALNASLESVFGLPSFIVTLATNAVFTGLIYIITNLIPISGLPRSFVYIGQGRLNGIPLPVLIMVPLAIAFYALARASVFGRHVVALGGNAEALRVAGVSIPRLRMKVYVLTGVCCGIASVLLTARSASAQIGAGSNLLLLVIAAVVIGGTPLLGGKTDIVGTIFGCLTIGIINNGINLLGVSAQYQLLIQGLLILLALLVDVQSARLLLAIAKARIDRNGNWE